MYNRLKIGLCLFAFTFSIMAGTAQQAPATAAPADTLQGLDSVVFSQPLFGSNRRQLSATGVSVRHLPGQLQMSNPTTLVAALNTAPGVRIEERSPGSYRLNIRGSSLRSPFGVRNIKMYFNDLPFTDAGGNTYFNQLAINSASTFHIHKGPGASMYGAGTGGVVLMEALAPAAPRAELEYSAGSYGLQQVAAAANWGKASHRSRLSYAHTRADGYRQQTGMRRDQVTFSSQLKTSEQHTLTATLLYTDLYYQTPGGLTQAEFRANPRAARPAGGGFPSAQAVNAAIYQQNLLAGLSSRWRISSRWSNTTAAYGAFARVRNSAIRNYESRIEPHFGGRTVFAWRHQWQQWKLHWQTGAEYQAGYFNTQVSRNRGGTRDSLLTNDDLQFQTGFVFTQLDADWGPHWYASAGLSLNSNRVAITRLSSLPISTQSRRYRPEPAPRLLLGYRGNRGSETQLTISRGFSPPTVSELLPSTGRISTDLEAESGFNFELSHRFQFGKGWDFQTNLFSFNLRNTLVQQRDAAGADFYINAGRTRQWGAESQLNWHRYVSPLLPVLRVQVSHTYSHFTYADYNKLGISYNGNRLPGVPRHALSGWVYASFKAGFYAHLSYYFNSSIQLNDANTFQADPFHVVGTRLGWRSPGTKVLQWHLFAGADNLLDQSYSLGNDINAAGNRFFNAAPGRNYFAGVGLQWQRPSQQPTNKK
jgi:iron complex outermembrane receptor protein